MKSEEISALNTKFIENPDEMITLRIRTMKDFTTALVNGTISDVKAMTAYLRHIMH